MKSSNTIAIINILFDNLSPNHRQALYQLHSLDDTVFRCFDKGAGLVIDIPENYEQKVKEHLGRTDTFTSIEEAKDTSPIPQKKK